MRSRTACASNIFILPVRTAPDLTRSHASWRISLSVGMLIDYGELATVNWCVMKIVCESEDVDVQRKKEFDAHKFVHLLTSKVRSDG